MDEEGFKKVMNISKQSKKNPTVSKPSNPTTSNSFKALATQHEEQATREDGVPPATKRLHQEIEKGKKTVESSKNTGDDPYEQHLHPKDSTHCPIFSPPPKILMSYWMRIWGT